MNIQLHHAVTDITGQTGLAILDAILAGERNPEALAQLRHFRLQEERLPVVSLRFLPEFPCRPFS